MKKIYLLVFVILLTLLYGCGNITETTSKNTAISFTDDSGTLITLDKPCEKIISLYDAHTENIKSLDATDVLIKGKFDYSADPERIIAEEPDCVLIRPFIEKKSPDFIKSLKNAGITVVSLYPDSMDNFDVYIEKLSMLINKEKLANEKLISFHKNLEEIQKITVNISPKQNVFFESTEKNLRTVTSDSMAGYAIELAGGKNVAVDVKPISPGSSIAPFGAEKILMLADSIDVYLAQNGAMNTADIESICVRPGFDTIKAVKEKRVYVIDEKLLSAPTFHYEEGVRQVAQFLYPQLKL